MKLQRKFSQFAQYIKIPESKKMVADYNNERYVIGFLTHLTS